VPVRAVVRLRLSGRKHMHVLTLLVQILLPDIVQIMLFFCVLTDSVFAVSVIVTVNLNNTGVAHRLF